MSVHDETCDLDEDCNCGVTNDPVDAIPTSDEWMDGHTWADDVPLMCGVENPDICESCT